ncbi:hypothetical protein BTUL_0010g00130 [Botrytis tulipae]|uniref:BTB domain-containing protein n=1 Tax=Botrytis tulipae TaxID=87230 RepID=A0A4Z1F175_9HELO|nr:hypothetical protein BTUL_0010g00130 [Botrytis tulipae]
MTRKRSHFEALSGSSTNSQDTDLTTDKIPTAAFFVDSVGTDMVDIHIGRDDDKKIFHVHKKKICAHSSYFKDFFGKGKRVTRLSNVSPKLFDILIEWIYTDKLRLSRKSISNSESYSLYQLAELLVLNAAMDKIMTFIRSRHCKKNFYFKARIIKGIYYNTFWNSQLRAYAIELFFYTLRGDTAEKKKVITNWDVESLLKVEGFNRDFIKLSRQITIEDPRASGCRFHVHEEDDVCEEADGDYDVEEDGDTDSNEESDEEEEEDEDEEEIKDE